MQSEEKDSGFWFVTAMILVAVVGLLLYAGWGSADEAQALLDFQARSAAGGGR